MAPHNRTCAICGIKERHCSEKRFFARFPLDKHRCAKWLKVVGTEDLAYLPIEKLYDLHHVCEIHFTKRDFTKSKTRLKKNAIPTLQLTSAPSLPDNIIAEFLRLNSHVPVLSRSQMPVPASIAPAASSAVGQYFAAVASTSVLETTPVVHATAIYRQDLTAVPSTSWQDPPSVEVPSTSCEDQPQMVTPSTSQQHNVQIHCIAVQSNQEDQCLTVDAPVPSTSRQSPLLSNQGQVAQQMNQCELDSTPRKKKLIAQLKKTKCTLASLKKSAKLIESVSSPVLKEFVLSALKNQCRKPQGKRWSNENKISALAIFKRSPKAYRYMQHVMPLPTIKTLQTLLKKIPMEPGINPSVINHLGKLACNFEQNEKFCSLAFDEIALKKRLIYNVATDKVEGFVDLGGEDGRCSNYADHALVFMLQGIGKKFKQPLAFYFVKGTVSSQTLAVTIKEIISVVNATGFKIVTTISDQGPTNLGALKLLRDWHSGGDNYFMLNDKKIYILYDVPHLFKSIRNNFLQNGQIEIDGKTGKWSHILEVEEQNRAFLYMSKITPTHVLPKYRAKMRVKYAAQILSQTVAAVLKLLARSKENEDRSDQILQTAAIVEGLNRLFDFTNGPSCSEDIKKGIRENVSNKTDHIKVWDEYQKKLTSLKFIGRSGVAARNVKCVDGYITSLKSLRDIWDMLRGSGYKYFNLRQVNQDCLENLFGLIRQHSPTDKHPTCSTFMAALKTSIISGMTAPHSKNSNCEKDFKMLLTNFHDIIFSKGEQSDEDLLTNDMSVKQVPESEEELPFTLSIPDDDEDYVEIESDLSQISKQSLVYVSGYIASILLKKQKCQKCKSCLSVEDPSHNLIYDLIKLKEWWQEKKSLTYPSVKLCRTVETAIDVFQKDLLHSLHRVNICQWTVTLLYANCDTTWVCPEHAQDMTHAMFVRLGLLLIRRQCQRVNITHSLKEEDLADAIKKGQQYGVAK